MMLNILETPSPRLSRVWEPVMCPRYPMGARVSSSMKRPLRRANYVGSIQEAPWRNRSNCRLQEKITDAQAL
jgi:hypothetical protein